MTAPEDTRLPMPVSDRSPRFPVWFTTWGLAGSLVLVALTRHGVIG